MDEMIYGTSAFVTVFHGTVVFLNPPAGRDGLKVRYVLLQQTALQGCIQLVLHLTLGLTLVSAAQSVGIACLAFVVLALILLKLQSSSSS